MLLSRRKIQTQRNHRVLRVRSSLGPFFQQADLAPPSCAFSKAHARTLRIRVEILKHMAYPLSEVGREADWVSHRSPHPGRHAASCEIVVAALDVAARPALRLEEENNRRHVACPDGFHKFGLGQVNRAFAGRPQHVPKRWKPLDVTDKPSWGRSLNASLRT